MLTKQVLIKMARGIRELIPEYEESNILRDEVINYIKKIPSLIFTEKDMEMKKQYPDYIVYQGNFCFGRPYYSGKDKEIPYIEVEDSYRFRDYHYYSYDFPISTELFFSNDMEDLKSHYPEQYQQLLPKVIKLVNTRNKYIKKFNKALEVLQKSDTTITLIKNNFPELYEKYKNS